MRPIVLSTAALAVLLVQLLSPADGAKRACPKIANVTTNVVPFSSLFPGIGEVIESDQLLVVSFIKTGKLQCECTLFENNDGRKKKLKASVKNCEHHTYNCPCDYVETRIALNCWH